MPTTAERAWLAGLFDGEGSVNVQIRPRKDVANGFCTVRLRVTNTHRPTIERVGEIVGEGRIRTMPRRSDRHRPVYEWCAESAMGVRFLKLVRPYLVTKRAQADLALESVRIRNNAPRVSRVGMGRGRGVMSPEVWDRLREIRAEVMALNGHYRSGYTIP